LQYTELGPTYCDQQRAPDAVGPWIGSVTHVSGAATVLHVANRSQVVVLDEVSGSISTVDVPTEAIVLPARTGTFAWIVARSGEPIVEFSSDGDLRTLWLRVPAIGARAGLLLGDDSALLVTREGGLVLFDKEGLRPITLPSGTPRVWSISAGPGSGYLLTHRKGCAVTALSDSFEFLWKFGGVAGNGPSQLSGPEHAFMWQGEVVVADTRNNRLVFLDARGSHSRVVAGGSVGSDRGLLSYPNSLSCDSAGRLLVGDAANSRLLAYEQDCTTRHTLWGSPIVRFNLFHYPRSAEPYGEFGILVADSYNHRVVSVAASGEVVDSWGQAEGVPFWWPRHAVLLDGSLTIVDSRNGRLVSAMNGSLVVKELQGLAGDRLIHADPHFLRPLPSGFLLSDTYANRVAQFDRSGRLVAAWGGEPHHSATETFVPTQMEIGVKDCHDGLMTSDGKSVWVADTGNHRVVSFSPDASHQRSFEPHGDLVGNSPLSYPRSISILGGYIAIADAGHHRLLVCEVSTGKTVWSFGGSERGLSTRTLNDPRFVRLHRKDDGMNLTAIDYGNHRILSWILPLPMLPT
jgi:DNA-binding beta-propeller fold protein YncE